MGQNEPRSIFRITRRCWRSKATRVKLLRIVDKQLPLFQSPVSSKSASFCSIMAGTAMCLHLQTSQVELPLQLSCAAFSSAQEASRVSFSPASSSGSVGCETLIRPWQHSISRSRKFGRTMAAVAASTIAESEKLPVEGEVRYVYAIALVVW